MDSGVAREGCFVAEPVIGPRVARTRWLLAMTSPDMSPQVDVTDVVCSPRGPTGRANARPLINYAIRRDAYAHPRIDVPDVASLICPTRHTLSDILFAF
jgi:hypothetical protein